MQTRQRPRLTAFRRGLIVAAVSMVVIAGLSFRSPGGEPDAKVQAAREQFFEQKVRPLLAENCYSCHGAKKQKGGLRLDSLEAILKGGESGPAVVPGKPEESLLVEAINYEGLEMPPTGKLDPEKVAVLTRWVALGAPWPSRDRAAPRRARLPADDVPKPKLSDADRAFWSFQPLREPSVPSSAATGSTRLGRLVAEPDRPLHPRQARSTDGLTPGPRGRPPTLIRRADVRPDGPAADARGGRRLRRRRRRPTPTSGWSTACWPRPRYGERWAPALARPGPLRRVRRLPPGRLSPRRLALPRLRHPRVQRRQALRPLRHRAARRRRARPRRPRAAGRHRLPAARDLRVQPAQRPRASGRDILNDITDVTGDVFLGLGIGCARCHDHKFDPILQKDYYRLQAFFTPLLPRDDLPLARPRQWAEYQAKLRRLGEGDGRGPPRRSTPIERPYRDKARPAARSPSSPTTSRRSSTSPSRIARRSSGSSATWPIARSRYEHEQVPTAQGAGQGPLGRAPEGTRARSIACEPAPPPTVLTVDRRRAGRAADRDPRRSQAGRRSSRASSRCSTRRRRGSSRRRGARSRPAGGWPWPAG